jgi:hypothetical protein
MAEVLTFEQVKKARVFAWHELHFIFANDTLLRVVLPVGLNFEPVTPEDAPMIVRPSSLRGTEHLLDNGWHHLDTCRCRFCAPHQQQSGSAAERRGRCGRPTK